MRGDQVADASWQSFIVTKILPPVPNVAGLSDLLVDVFAEILSCVGDNLQSVPQTGRFKSCNTEAWTRFQPNLKPPRLLPALSEVDAQESRNRFNYWSSFLCLSPVFMACVCELIRLCVLNLKRPRGQEQSSRSSRVVSRKDQDLQVAESSVGLPSWAEHGCFMFSFIMYHLFCASLVIIALCNDWVTLKGGGSFSWELWAIWQQVCLWNLFAQELWRCWREDVQSLMQPTFAQTLRYTCPFVGQPADTLRDWILTGVCLKANPHLSGFVAGGILVVADLVHRCRFDDPPDVFPFRISKKLRIWPPFTIILLLIPLVFVVMNVAAQLLHLCEWAGGKSISLAEYAGKLGTSASHLTQEMWLSLSDGGSLAILYAYTTVLSNVLAISNHETFQGLCNRYIGILSLPKGLPFGFEPRIVYELSVHSFINLCSTLRLLLVWTEDLPQGLIGLVFVAAHQDQMGRIGFATISVAIGLAKGVLIPTGQGFIRVERALTVKRLLHDGEELLKLLPTDFDIGALQATSQAMKKAQISLREVKNEIEQHSQGWDDLSLADKAALSEILDARLHICERILETAKVHFTSNYETHGSTFRHAIEQRKAFVRQACRIGEETLYEPINDMINGWLDSTEFNDKFFSELATLLEQFDGRRSTDFGKAGD